MATGGRSPCRGSLRRRLRFRWGITAACLLAPGLWSAPAAQAPPPDDPAPRTLAAQVRRLLNEARAAEGLRPLAGDVVLDRLAAAHSREMARRGRVSHYSDTYGLTTVRRVRLAFPWALRIGENVARNRSVEALHRALMRSPGHRRNRLDAAFTHVGIGLARGSPYYLYLTEIYVQAPDGAPLGAPLALYFEADPGTFERRDAPRTHVEPERFTVLAPGPDDPEHWTSLGVEAFRRGELPQAEAAFRRALELGPDYHYARYNLSRVLIRRGRPQEAAELLERYLRRFPEDLDARFARGTAALLLGDYRGAEAIFRQVLDRRPGDAGAWYNLALALEYGGDLDAAAAAYAQAVHLDPDLAAAHAGLARVQGTP